MAQSATSRITRCSSCRIPRPAVLLEICFVDSEADCEIYQNPANFKEICINLAEALNGDEEPVEPPEPETDTGRRIPILGDRQVQLFWRGR